MRVFKATPPYLKAITPLLGLIAVGACGDGEAPPTVLPSPNDTAEPSTTGTPNTSSQLPPCDPPLTISPENGLLPPYQLLQFVGAGGSGSYRFTLASPANGDIHPTTGTYGAPGEVGAVDQVVLTDPSCIGEAVAEVVVTDALHISPASAEVLPATEFTFEIFGGIGGFSCAMVNAESGGTVDASCAYVAGANDGVDTIEVTDDEGYTAMANIVVSTDAILRPDGYGHWFVPLGASLTPAAQGGSGVLDLTLLSGTATVNGAQVEGTVVGRSEVRVTDRFAGFTYDVLVDVVAPLGPDYPWVGARINDSRTVALGDVNGDGFDDFAVAIADFNGGRYDGGAVMIYAGASGGPSPTPTQVILGDQREQDLGSALTIGDVDLDGEPDLLVGVDRDDILETDIGSVRIYRGVAGGFFEPEPTWVLPGTRTSDRAGGSVGVCDLNGDSWPEVIAGASGAEDRSLADFPNSSGALLVYEGMPGGFVTDPVIVRYGVRLDATGTAWELAESLKLGERDLAVGDVNGDGLCDVLASIVDKGINDAAGGDGEGYALLWHGQSSGFLTAEPVRVFAEVTDGNAEFGRRVAMADFDGDGLDDVVVASHNLDFSSSNNGGIAVFLTAEDDGRPALTPYTGDEASWFATGPSGSDFLGRGLSTGDYDGDGVPDVVGGAYAEDELETNGGQIRVWSGVDIAASPAEDQWDAAIAIWSGNENDGRLGESAAILGDVDGDGLNDLAGLASEADHFGADVGRPMFWSNGTELPLDLVGGPAGDQSGRSLAWIDTNADGLLDLVAGAPQTYLAIEGTLAGDIDAFAQDASGNFGATVAVNVPEELTSYDRFAETLTAESDFNGDGYKDLVVGSRAMPTPGTYDAAYDNPEGCVEDLGDSGAIAIYLGGPTGVALDPSFLWFTTDPHSNTEALAGGFDHNGDGYEDVIVADEDWDVGGGFTIVYGQEWSGNTTVLCGDPPVLSLESGGELGHSVAGIGDVNGDGCDEVAVTGLEEHGTGSDRGVVHVLWGFDGPGCPNASERTSLQGLVDGADLGEAIDGGRDVDGDGLPDFVVSSTNLDVGGTNAGGVYLVTGAYLLTLPTESEGLSNWPDPADMTFEDLPQRTINGLLLGTESAVEFGETVALIDDPIDPNRAALAVGLPLGAVGGTALSGGVRIHRWDPSAEAWESEAYAIMGGESHLAPGELGSALSALPSGQGSGLAVGAFWSHQIGPDRGACYPLSLD